MERSGSLLFGPCNKRYHFGITLIARCMYKREGQAISEADRLKSLTKTRGRRDDPSAAFMCVFSVSFSIGRRLASFAGQVVRRR
jgi:hypothetical protein